MRVLPGLFLTLAMLATCVNAAIAAPITFNTALPVGAGKFVNREQFILARSGHDPSNSGREVDTNSLESVLAYGVSGKLSMFGILPLVGKELRLPGGVKRDSSGFGDARLFARYSLYQRDNPGRTFRVAGFGGIKIPTGDDDETDSLGRLPIPLQSGTGSWDASIGGVISYQTLDFGVDTQLSYRANTEANDFEAGDVTRLDASLQYRLWPVKIGSDTASFLYGVLEANIVHSQKDAIFGQSIPDSGGTTVFITPGIQYAAKKWILEAAVQLPVSQNLNGNALENDYVFRAGFRINF
ncbi:MAG: transporter [Candidatus Tectomicrobia bacterium]